MKELLPMAQGKYNRSVHFFVPCCTGENSESGPFDWRYHN